MLGMRTSAYGWAVTLSFISGVIAFSLLFPLEAGDTHGCFVDVRGWENTKHGIRRGWQRKHCSVPVAESLGDRAAGRGRRYRMRLAQGKIEIPGSYCMPIALALS